MLADDQELPETRISRSIPKLGGGFGPSSKRSVFRDFYSFTKRFF
jgi:hypothetical protein